VCEKLEEFTSTLTESNLELDDIFTWQEPRKVTKNLTITYDKCIYMLEPTELNHKLAGQYISILEYPDGTVALMHEGRKLNYSIFNKLAGLQQNEIVENKRLGSVLAHIQQQHEDWKNKINVPVSRKVCRVVKLRKLLLNKEI
jgi:hypothetical protein